MKSVGALRKGWSWTLALVAILVLPVSGAEETHDFTVTDSDQVYYGEGKHPDAPAVTEADKVWAEIPEYKRIVDEDLDDDDPQYHILMRKATERFEKALKKVAERDKYDLIAETGAVKSDTKKAIPDITEDLIEVVKRD